MNLKISESIKALRNEMNITQAELAEKLSVSPQAVSRWENGQAYPDIELLVKIADFFKVSMDELMGRESSDLIDLGQKLRSLRKQYYQNGAKDNDVLMQLCNILEKLCAVEPIQYAAEYILLSKDLCDHTHYGEHFSKAQNMALAVFPVMDAKIMNQYLDRCVMYVDESNLEKWSKHITNDSFLSTWNDVLIERYFFNSDVEKHEKARQESIYSHLCQLLSRLTDHKPTARPSEDHPFSYTTPTVEACRTAKTTLSFYSKNPFDIFFLVRFSLESKLTLALFEEGYFDAGLNNLSKLKQYATKLHQMIEEKTVRRGSVPTLSLVERTTEERDAIRVKCFLSHEKSSIFDKVRQEESFISAFREMNALFGQDSISRIDRRIACANSLLRAVLKQAFRDLPPDAQKRLIEQYTEGKKDIGLRSIKCTCFPEENDFEKAAVDDFVSYVEVEFPNPKNNLTFEVTVKDGYLRSIISSECEENLPQFSEKYEIVKFGNSANLRASELYFKENRESDLCVHGKVSFEIGGDQLSDSREWCVSASAYRFLKTVTENHPYVGDDNQMIPCCGTIMPAEMNEQPVLISCPSGIDFEITHIEDFVRIKTAQGKIYKLPFSAYKNAVFSFAKQIIDFYEQSPPRRFEDKYEENGFNSFFVSLHALLKYDPDDWRFADEVKNAVERAEPRYLSNSERQIIVLLSNSGKVYTVRYSTINDGIDANIEELIKEMNGDTKIKRMVCFLGGGIDYPSYAFRDKLCRLNHANLDTLTIMNGFLAPSIKPLRATMAKGYADKLLGESDVEKNLNTVAKESNFDFLKCFLSYEITISENGELAKIHNPFWNDHITVEYSPNDSVMPFAVYFSFQHQHFSKKDDVVEYINSIISGNIYAIEFFNAGKRRFGGEITADVLKDMSYETLEKAFPYFDGTALCLVADSFKVRGWNPKDNIDAVFVSDSQGNPIVVQKEDIELINQLKGKGVTFSRGLTNEDLENIRNIYSFSFPKVIESFYRYALPVSDDPTLFPRWNDFSEENVNRIKEWINSPQKWLALDVSNGQWLNIWGERPQSKADADVVFSKLLSASPKLIPIYGHRFYPLIEGIDDPPIISTVGMDTVYYGSGLRDYLRREFLSESPFIETINVPVSIPFWSDIIHENHG